MEQAILENKTRIITKETRGEDISVNDDLIKIVGIFPPEQKERGIVTGKYFPEDDWGFYIITRDKWTNTIMEKYFVDFNYGDRLLKIGNFSKIGNMRLVQINHIDEDNPKFKGYDEKLKKVGE